jgi:YVTN family beta-propeller protein
MTNIFRTLCLFSLPFMMSCEKEPAGYPLISGFSHGIVITNEGTFTQNNGSVSFIDSRTDSIIPDLFQLANNRPLGDVVQSFGIADSLGFIIANNSMKVEVVRLNDFTSVGLIQASYPRYFHYAGNGKGYLTNGAFPGEVLVIDTRILQVVDTILVGAQPEHLLISNNRLFVANGKWGNDNTLSVIDISADSVIKTIEVGDGPTDLVKSDNQSLWIICQGKVIYNNDWTQIIEETDSRLVRINPVTLEKTADVIIGTMGDGFNPYLIAAGPTNDIIYFTEADGIHSFSTQTLTQSTVPLIPGFFYGMGVNPLNGNIFAMEAKGYTSNGAVYIFTPGGTLVKSFDTGIGPNGVVFY